MRTVVLGQRPRELDKLIERRRATGADRYDEVWEGEYHMAPAPHSAHGQLENTLAALLRPLALRAGLVPTGSFNLGRPEDYRVPDGGLHVGHPSAVWLPTAALVLEIVSPGDESWDKLPFYAAHGVDEVVIADPHARRVAWLARRDDGYEPATRSALLDVAAADLVADVDWPPVDER